MKIIVCVKQVPDTSGKVSVKPDGTLDRASMDTITNPDDLNAVEAALSLKDRLGAEVIVISMGPPPAEGMLRELMARGATAQSWYQPGSSADPIPTRPPRSLRQPSKRSGLKRRILSYADGRPSTAIPPRWARRSPRSWDFPRCPMRQTLRRREIR